MGLVCISAKAEVGAGLEGQHQANGGGIQGVGVGTCCQHTDTHFAVCSKRTIVGQTLGGFEVLQVEDLVECVGVGLHRARHIIICPHVGGQQRTQCKHRSQGDFGVFHFLDKGVGGGNVLIHFISFNICMIFPMF